MANGGIIGPVITTEKKVKPKTTILASSGTFTKDSNLSKNKTVVIAGGGGGGTAPSAGAGGGGSGGLTIFSCQPFPSCAVTVTVGAGGAGGSCAQSGGSQGSNSVFASASNPRTMTGGGLGGGQVPGHPATGGPGGAGGGGGYASSPCSAAG